MCNKGENRNVNIFLEKLNMLELCLLFLQFFLRIISEVPETEPRIFMS
jgi:hypothetical protein